MIDYFNIFSNFSDSVVIVDPSTNKKVYFNTAAHTRLGYTREEFAELPIKQSIERFNHEFITKYHQAVIDGHEFGMLTKHKRKDGTIQYADIKLVPVTVDGNTYVCTIWKDITEHVLREKDHDKKSARLNHFLEVLEKLTKSKAFKEGDINAYFWRVVEVISKVLDMDRVSIRLYSSNKKELKSYAMYDKIKKRQINGKSLTQDEHPRFFNYIKNERLIKIDDINENEELKTMIEVFFSKDGMINSLLANKIYVGNEVVGYIFFQSRKKVSWDQEDILFANQIASNISMMLINAKLLEHNLQLEDMVDQRTTELKKQIAIAENANKAKSQFLSNICHEIRTPLNAILGFISLIDKKNLSSELYTYIERIEKGSNQLYGIVNDVLDMSKIESGKMTLQPSWTDLALLVNETIESFDAQFKGKNLVFELQLQLINQQFYLDDVRVKQILNNLISNALKFTEQGQVSLCITENVVDSLCSRLEFVLKDTGIGIKKEDQPKLFLPFEQLEQADIKRYQGTGLGLAITKSIVQSMGGNISVESDWGKGSTFYVDITTESKKVENQGSIVKHKESNEQQVKFRRVLIVDDHPINLEFLFDTFQPHSEIVEKAHHGYDALKQVEKETYDLIIMDIHMPSMSGYQTSRLIKMIPHYQHVKIVALSADALDEKIKNAEDYGIDKYLVKPISGKNMILECEKVYQEIDLSVQAKTPFLKDIFTEDIGFNISSAMTYLGHKPSLFVKLMKQFVDNHTQDLKLIGQYLDQGKDNDAKLIVHNLKGVLKTLGMEKLSAEMVAFEEQLLKKSKADDIKHHFKHISQLYDDMMYIVSYILRYIKEVL